MTKNKTAVVCAVTTAGLGIALVWEYQAMTKLREENRALRLQSEQLTGLAEENRRLSNLVAQASQSQPMSKDQFQELLRLRGEVGVLRKQKSEDEKLHAGNGQLRSTETRPAQPQSQAAPDFVSKESWAFVDMLLQNPRFNRSLGP